MSSPTPLGSAALLASFASISALIAGCGSSESTATPTESEAAPMPASLQLGQSTYQEDCRRCHAIGLEGAPKVKDAATWQKRLDNKGIATLYNHSINGWLSPSMAEMPAKGGNPDLSDEAVMAAVDYMLWSATGLEPTPP